MHLTTALHEVYNYAHLIKTDYATIQYRHGKHNRMTSLLCCCCSGSERNREPTTRVYREPRREDQTTVTQDRDSIPEDERKYLENIQLAVADDIDPRALNHVKKKVRNALPPDTSYEQVCSISKRYVSAQKMSYYFSHLVLETAGDVVLETAEETETSFNNAWERAMLQKRTLQRLETVTHFPVKLILRDLQHALPLFVSSFAKMLQLEFGPLHAALIIDDVILEWDDSGLILPSQVDEEWILQTRLQGTFNRFALAMKSEMRDSARRMDLKKQIEQVFEVTKEKQQAINQLIEVVIHYNTHYEYNVLTRNCQHFVVDAMKALGINKVPQFTGVFQEYFRELKSGKSTDILEKFETHAELDEHVNTIIKPGLTQHDLEYLLCQYFMFHVSSCKRALHGGKDPEWKCEEESCRMYEIEQMLERDAGSLLFTTFSLNNS